MSRYVTIDTLKWALAQLKDSCNGLFVDFLLLKRDGLGPGNPVTINTKSTEPSAKRLMGILKSDGSVVDKDHVFFNPFVAQWRHEGYPRSGTYSTLDRSKTFASILTAHRPGIGMTLSLGTDYIDAVQQQLRRSKNKPLQVPLEALAAWALRYDTLPDDITVEEVVEKFATEYQLSSDERSSFFSAHGDVPQPFFADEPLVKDALVTHLMEIAPSEEQPSNQKGVESVIEDLPEDLIEFLRDSLILPEALLRQLATLLRAGKHIILTGPPGTGKSTLAGKLAQVSERFSSAFSFPHSKGHIFTTATADWTTFDTLGGYMPKPDSAELQFQEGLFLQALRENKWLVIDELNRADVDKAFGQLFTVLSGHSVTMPYKAGDGKNVQLVFDRNSAQSGFDKDTGSYVLGRDWRIIATMNTFDRNLLFQLSAAFVRRFAVVHVGIPEQAELIEWIEGRGLAPIELNLVSKLIAVMSDVRPLGPAIWSDLVDYMEMRTKHSIGASGEFSEEASFTDAVIAYVLPQLDGLDRESLQSVEAGLIDLIENPAERARLRSTFKDVF
ncbi:dynein-related subfamily AAA family protein [Dongia mobilis]|uniref:Dynein-related subfamily AAA family protein n=1 Tax=Dongia mobilis TaxID=578943 RepID=A0A4R6WZ37_9PROT|nr:MoxR family ATPase [Dongia mobilis]TDQ83077.1 dynein-related subfamily AAA family protein [Dongia mobilis]